MYTSGPNRSVFVRCATDARKIPGDAAMPSGVK